MIWQGFGGNWKAPIETGTAAGSAANTGYMKTIEERNDSSEDEGLLGKSRSGGPNAVAAADALHGANCSAHTRSSSSNGEDDDDDDDGFDDDYDDDDFVADDSVDAVALPPPPVVGSTAISSRTPFTCVPDPPPSTSFSKAARASLASYDDIAAATHRSSPPAGGMASYPVDSFITSDHKSAAPAPLSLEELAADDYRHLERTASEAQILSTIEEMLLTARAPTSPSPSTLRGGRREEPLASSSSSTSSEAVISFLPSFLPSLFPTFLPSILFFLSSNPFFFSSLLSFLSSFLPFFLPAILFSCLPSFLPSLHDIHH
jgi:hypothetical protein